VSSKASSSANTLDGLDVFPSQSVAAPQRAIEVGPTQQSRYEEHYNNTLSRDLLYMTYDHAIESQLRDPEAKLAAAQRPVSRGWDPTSPYVKNRPLRAPRGNRPVMPSALNYADETVELERIVISSFSKDAITNKQALIPLLAVMRAITGRPIIEAQADPAVAALNNKLPKHGYVQLIRAKSNVASFKIRKGIPVGVKAVLPKKAAYQFLEILSTFVLPRMRGFNGFLLPPPSQGSHHASATTGVVSLGMEPEAFGLFPQTEVNWDNYPGRIPGFQIDCVTNQRGLRATEKARQLLSGLGLPFVRRGD
jgi:large subunit ribosomal protein L5